MSKTIDQTRCFSVYDHVLDGHDIVCRTGLHSTIKVAKIRVSHGVQICTVEELATLICDYLDKKLLDNKKDPA